MIHGYMRRRHWRALLWVARVLAGLAAALLGAVVFVTNPGPAVMGDASRISQSVKLTFSSLILAVVGFVIVVGPDKINQIAKRNRQRQP